MLPLADVSFGDLLLLVFEMFLFVVWIWILFTIITDLFRNHDMSGWLKAVWIILLVFIPYITALVYLIIYGNDMRERTTARPGRSQTRGRRLHPLRRPRLARRRTPQTARTGGERRAHRGRVRPRQGETAA